MRLIDADELKRNMEFVCMGIMAGTEDYNAPLTEIDNAPTVFDCRGCKNNGNERECVDCHDYSNYIHYDERPQGKTNADLFKQTFGIYATEIWSMSEKQFLEWLNEEVRK